MQLLLRICWYLFTLSVAIYCVPFALTRFTVWQLLSVWPFILVFFGVIAIVVLGFQLPSLLESNINRFLKDVTYMKLFLFLATIFGVLYIGSAIREPAQVQREIYNKEQQNKLNQEQIEILVKLESISVPAVKEFVSDWRTAYGDRPTTESLAELKIIEQRINANAKDAEQFTTRHHRESMQKLSSVVTPVFGFGTSESDAKPGL